MILNGSEILVNVLLEQGVDTVFGYPGGAVLNIYDALYKYKDKLTHYMTAHEQGAAHAADGYARATGKTGVVIATSGPGATNLTELQAAQALYHVQSEGRRQLYRLQWRCRPVRRNRGLGPAPPTRGRPQNRGSSLAPYNAKPPCSEKAHRFRHP